MYLVEVYQIFIIHKVQVHHHWIVQLLGTLNEVHIKTDSPKRVVAIVHFTTISGHFLANPLNIFRKTEALLVILN